MTPLFRFPFLSLLAVSFLVGCGKDDPKPAQKPAASVDSGAVSGSENEGRSVPTNPTAIYYPDVPVRDVMTEVDGIPIPRVKSAGTTLDLNARIPVDEYNPAAQKNPSKPVPGGRIVMRIHSEPKTMNPVTETSAVQSIMTVGYVSQAFAHQDPETYDFKPLLATRWLIEDSIKLAPDYPGYERYVSLPGGEPAAGAELAYPAVVKDAQPPEIVLTTYGADRKPLAGVWVGLFPIGNILGAPTNGYHEWSKEDGKVGITGIKPGRYTVKVGHEIIGVAEVEGDGGRRIRSESPNNPLSQMVNADGYLDLTKDQFVDIQQGTVFTYFIDPRAKWSDGAPFTAKDLEFAYRVINNPFVDGDSIRVYYSDIVRCEALDPKTLRMQYRQQYFMAFEFTAGLPMYTPPWHVFENKYKTQAPSKTLTFEHLTPEEEAAQNKISVSGAAFGKAFNEDGDYGRKPLGTGPYLIDSWVNNDRLVLKRNPNYWTDEHKGYLDEIVFKVIIEDVTAIDALRTGAIDFLYRINASHYHESLKGPPAWMKDKYVKASWYIPSFSYIGWNLNRPLFQDRKVRIALRMLLDMEEFREKKYHGDSVLVSGSQYYFAPAYDQSVKPLAFDLDTARELLSDAGWADTDGDGILDKDGKKFEFKFLLSTGSETAQHLSALLQENGKRVGISIQIDRLEWASFLERVQNKDFDAVTLAWLSSPESDPYQIWHSSGAGPQSRSSNHVSFSNPEADSLIEMLRVTLDKDKRNAIYHSFHRLLDSEQPYAFLHTPKDFGAYHQKFRGVKWYRLRPGFDLTEWYIPKELQ